MRYGIIFIFQLQWLAFRTITAHQPSFTRVGEIVHFNIWPEGCHFSISAFDVKEGAYVNPRKHSDSTVVWKERHRTVLKADAWPSTVRGFVEGDVLWSLPRHGYSWFSISDVKFGFMTEGTHLIRHPGRRRVCFIAILQEALILNQESESTRPNLKVYSWICELNCHAGHLEELLWLKPCGSSEEGRQIVIIHAIELTTFSPSCTGSGLLANPGNAENPLVPPTFWSDIHFLSTLLQFSPRKFQVNVWQRAVTALTRRRWYTVISPQKWRGADPLLVKSTNSSALGLAHQDVPSTRHRARDCTEAVSYQPVCCLIASTAFNLHEEVRRQGKQKPLTPNARTPAQQVSCPPHVSISATFAALPPLLSSSLS